MVVSHCHKGLAVVEAVFRGNSLFSNTVYYYKFLSMLRHSLQLGKSPRIKYMFSN